MARVLKPGGTMVIACWCQREETPDNPFSEKDKADLKFLYDEWAHPYFISIQEFERLMLVGVLLDRPAVALAVARRRCIDWLLQGLVQLPVLHFRSVPAMLSQLQSHHCLTLQLHCGV
jgi:hypothetical protein